MAESNIKSQDLKKGSVAILNASGNVVGSGFIAAPNYYICTCAHVVESTGNSDKIEVIFFNGIRGIAIVEMLDKNADIAILISNSIPKNAKPLILGESQYSDGQSFRSFGFPNRVGELSGGYAQGNIMGAISNGLLQITGDSVEPGMSGSPILSVESNLVIGMLSMFRDNQNQARIAYAIPTELLQKTYPKLDLQKPSRRQVEPNQEQTYRQAIQKDPKDTTAYLRLGNLLEKQKKLIEAEELFRNAIKAIPNDSRLYRELGRALELQAKFEEAMEFYEKSIQLNPKDGRSYQSMGIVMEKMKRFDEAEANFRQAIKLINDANIYRGLGGVLEKQKRFEEAIDAYRKANAIRPDSGWTNRRIEELTQKQKASDSKPSTPDSSTTKQENIVQPEPVLSEAPTTENILSEQPTESGNSNEPPVQPITTEQTEEPEPLPEEPTPELSDVIKPYTITEDALDKHVATDKPIQSVKQDKLDFKIYVNALHSFILSKYTTTPITISVDGVWGTGKSSLMSMLKGKLDPQRDSVRKFFEWWSLFLPRVRWYWWFLWSSLPKAYGKALIALVVRNDVDKDGIYLYVGDRVQLFKNHVARIMDGFSIAPETLNQSENENLDKKVRWWAQVNANCEPMEPPYHYTVWLNAWKFDNQEEVWASLALATMEQIKQKHGLFWRLRFWLEITFSRLSFLEGLWQVVKQFLLPLVFGVVAAYYEVILGSFDVQLEAFKNYGSPLLVAGAFISGLLSVWSIFKDPFQIPLDKVFDRPNYKDKVKFLSHFEKDFARIVRAATKNGFGWKRSKLVIFIDDLDRCEPPKSADIVEAVNLFLDAEGCVFVIGMDSESVAMSIEVKYKELFERMKAENSGVVSLGRLFLDKIVQIPFSMPRPTPQQITSLVKDTLGAKVLSLSVNFSIGNGSNSPVARDSSTPVVDAASDQVTDIQTPEQTENIPLVAQPRVDPASYAKPEVRAAILKGTELLAENPRQVKTFINLFRLSIYIANERKILEEKIVAEQTSGLNLEKLAIWTACSVRWTGLVRHLYTETQTDSLCNFIHNVSEDLTPGFSWKTGNKNIPGELKKKLDALRKSEKGSEAHWCHLPWEWWLLEPDFLKTIKSMQDLWRPTAAGETAWLKSLLTMTKPIA